MSKYLILYLCIIVLLCGHSLSGQMWIITYLQTQAMFCSHSVRTRWMPLTVRNHRPSFSKLRPKSRRWPIRTQVAMRVLVKRQPIRLMMLRIVKRHLVTVRQTSRRQRMFISAKIQLRQMEYWPTQCLILERFDH